MNVIAPSGVGIKIIENVINVIKDKIKGGFDDCQRVSILLVIAELVLMMFPDLRVLWTITDNFLWEIEETGLYQQKCWIQCRYF